MEGKNKIEVLIGGSVYTLVGKESQEYMQQIALYIDKKMDELKQSESTSKLSMNLIAILTSINVADDLFKLQHDYSLLKDKLNEEEIEQIKHQEAIEVYQQRIENMEHKLKDYEDREITYEQRIDELKEQLLNNELDKDEEIKGYKEKLSDVYEELDKFKHELGKVQEENMIYEKLLDECQLEILQYRDELKKQ